MRLVRVRAAFGPKTPTGLNANRLIQECLTGIAMRKQGITEEHFLSPLTVEDGREDR
jgi:agmatinase